MKLARWLGPVILLATFAVGAIVAACGSDDNASGPPPLGTGGTARDAGPRDSSGNLEPFDAGAIEASAGARTFKGTLDATLPVKFGGSPYCEYSMTFKEVAIEVAALESGDLIGATVKNLVVEASLPPCPHPPMTPVLQSYALTTSTKTATGVTLAFEGAKTNQPATALVIELVPVGVTYEASAEWKRTDQKAPLDWAVKAKLTLVAAD